jgi:hypothetical protein
MFESNLYDLSRNATSYLMYQCYVASMLPIISMLLWVEWHGIGNLNWYANIFYFSLLYSFHIMYLF